MSVVRDRQTNDALYIDVRVGGRLPYTREEAEIAKREDRITETVTCRENVWKRLG